MKLNTSKAISPAKTFSKDEGGAITALNLFFVLVMAILGGIAIDVASLVQARTQLQVAADTAAHTALYARDRTNDKDAAKQEALDIASAIMPTGRYGDVLRLENIHFGTYDKTTKKFSINENSRDAVYVKTDRLSENSNPVTSFLLRIVGFADWDVATESIFETYRKGCLREGFVAEDVVDIQSGNGFYNGFCVHSNTHVSANQNNVFELGTIVSMPNIELLDIPNSGFEKNEGLAAALFQGGMNILIVNRINEIVDGMTAPGSRYYRKSYLDNHIMVKTSLTSNNNNVTVAMVNPNRVNEFTCTKSNGSITMEGDVFKNAVIITNCPVNMSSGTAFEDVTLITEDTSVKSITAPSGLRIGKDDNCADGGGAEIITYGGISQAAKVEIYNGQLLAVGPITFAASNEGIKGASIVSGSTIDATSGSKMAFCGKGMGSIFEAEYFRMAG